MLWAVSRWRPVWRVSFTEARALLRFGSHVVVSGMLDIFYTQGFALLIGKMYGVADVGIYARAQNTQNLPAGVISGIIGRISLPILASRIGDMEQLQRAAARSIRLAMAMVMPTMVGLAAMADVAVALLYGPAWAAAAPILAVLALASAFYPHGLIVQYGILAQDKSRAYLNLVALKIGLGLLSVVVGSFFGIMGLAYSQLAYSFGAIWLNAHAARRHLSYGYWQQFRDMAGLCVAAAGMGIGIVLLRSMTALHPAWEALIFIPAGAAIYLTLGLALRLEPVREALHIAASSLPKRRTAGPGSVQDRGKP
jgi:O-antigen/teichoic acid export membrane protein